MRKALIDINVVLDVLLDREPHVSASASVWAAIELGAADGFLAAHGVTTIYYLVQKEQNSQSARRTITAILKVFRIAPLDDAIVRRALDLKWRDFEDSVVAAAAESTGCDFIVTRDSAGFPNSPVRVVTPEMAAVLLRQSEPTRE